jgi:hypothetical protein
MVFNLISLILLFQKLPKYILLPSLNLKNDSNNAPSLDIKLYVQAIL